MNCHSGSELRLCLDCSNVVGSVIRMVSKVQPVKNPCVAVSESLYMEMFGEPSWKMGLLVKS